MQASPSSALKPGKNFHALQLREDGTKLVMLALNAETAHQYSKRLSQWITAAWKQSAADLAQNKLNRVGVFMPPWCKFDDDRVVLDPERAAIVRKVFELAQSDAAQIVATRLNEEGVPGLADQTMDQKQGAPPVERPSGLGCCSLVWQRRPHSVTEKDMSREDDLKSIELRIVEAKSKMNEVLLAGNLLN